MLNHIDLDLLATVTGGAGGMPLSGDVTQFNNYNTNWGGTQIINQPPQLPKPPTTVLEYWHQHPELRMNPPRPVRPLGRF